MEVDCRLEGRGAGGTHSPRLAVLGSLDCCFGPGGLIGQCCE